ncbi:hypothetical protein OG21DRAFT_1516181 [Imleria badia]|nr:hypothetical protein OG21DRAFT_1516181 [Imleria badia]
MSSAVQSALTSLRQNDYASLAILTAVGYDYVLTFSDEIEYIWNKPWTWVSALFILVCIALHSALWRPAQTKHCYRFAIVAFSISQLFPSWAVASYLALPRYLVKS